MANNIVNTGIGGRIRARREELQLSQDDLAKRMGYSTRSTICKVERGEDNITAERVGKFARALRCSELFLLGVEGNPELSAEIKQANALTELARNDRLMTYAMRLMDLKEEQKELVFHTIDVLSSN